MESQHGGSLPLDRAVIEALPSGTIVDLTERHGDSVWSATASITGKTKTRAPSKFFIKYATGSHGKAQLAGEYRSIQEIVNVMPDFAPKPLAFGQLADSAEPTYFFFCEFVDFKKTLPDPVKLGEQLAELHRMSASPIGMFGFYQTTYDGHLPQKTDWDSSWPRFFSSLLLHIHKLDEETNGSWIELEVAVTCTVNEVIPRLLGVLEDDGRSIKPCLIHGDLWEGNIGTHSQTEKLYIFDAACYYAHNEMELGIWRCKHHGMDLETYSNEYKKNFEPSEPKAEWDDRNRLYSVKTQLMYSAHVKGSPVRQSAFEDLQFLIEKYGGSAT